MRRLILPTVLIALVSATASASSRLESREGASDTLAGHPVSLDAGGKLLSWVEKKDAAYPEVVRLAFERLLTGFPVEDNGQPTWLTYCCFDGQSLRGGELAAQPGLVLRRSHAGRGALLRVLGRPPRDRARPTSARLPARARHDAFRSARGPGRASPTPARTTARSSTAALTTSATRAPATRRSSAAATAMA